MLITKILLDGDPNQAIPALLNFVLHIAVQSNKPLTAAHPGMICMVHSKHLILKTP